MAEPVMPGPFPPLAVAEPVMPLPDGEPPTVTVVVTMPAEVFRSVAVAVLAELESDELGEPN